MIVPNYMPDPIEVPGNVTTERYSVRLAFIRRVIGLYMASLGLIWGFTMAPIPHFGIEPSLVVLIAFLLILEFVRIRWRGKRQEPIVSCVVFIPVILLLALSLRELQIAKFPVWAFFVGPTCAAIYASLCGRDFSFVGCFFLSLIASSVMVAVGSISLRLSGPSATCALLTNFAYLLYWVYDLAALMARRRIGEEAAAVVDLYRDVFNIFGYIPRVIYHWKKHRIWVVPPASHRQRED